MVVPTRLLAPKVDRHSCADKMQTAGPFGRSSAGENDRPSAIGTRSAPKKSPDTRRTRRGAGAAPDEIRLTVSGVYAASCVKAFVPRWSAWNRRYETAGGTNFVCRLTADNATSVAGSSKATGFNTIRE